jgi:hypothetical protein
MRLVDGVDGIPFSEALAAEGAVVFAKARELDQDDGLRPCGFHDPERPPNGHRSRSQQRLPGSRERFPTIPARSWPTALPPRD